MCSTIEICNGAFTAELVKGEDGKKRWKYTPTFKKQEKKQAGSHKEKPQFKLIPIAERAEVDRYNQSLKQTVLEITKFLKDDLH